MDGWMDGWMDGNARKLHCAGGTELSRPPRDGGEFAACQSTPHPEVGEQVGEARAISVSGVVPFMWPR